MLMKKIRSSDEATAAKHNNQTIRVDYLRIIPVLVRIKIIVMSVVLLGASITLESVRIFAATKTRNRNAPTLRGIGERIRTVAPELVPDALLEYVLKPPYGSR